MAYFHGADGGMETGGSRFNLRAYWRLTKPRLWLMLTYTAGIGFLASLKVQSGHWEDGLLAIVACGLGTSGANVITCYLDKDVDSIMERTRKRPIPSGHIRPPSKALHFGIILAVSSIILLLTFSKFTAVMVGLFGLFDNVIVYSVWLKRRSPLNIILGGFSGGAPVVVGWSVNASILHPVPIIMAAIIVLWIPSHIWSLAFKWREDYSKAGIPMLTAVIDQRKAVLCVASTSILIFLFSLSLAFLSSFGIYYLAVAVIAGSMLIVLTAWMVVKPQGSGSGVLFRFTSPYLAILLAAAAL